MSILFKNCTIVAKENGAYKVIENGFLGVDGKTIDYIDVVAPGKKYDEEYDYTGKLLMPGLANAHGHASMTILRGIGPDLPLDRWLNEEIFPREALLTEEDIARGTDLAIKEMLAGGTTCYEDMYDFPWASVPVCDKAGIKVRMGRVLLKFDPVEGRRLGECVDFFNKYHKVADGRVRADIAVHSEYLTEEPQIKALGEIMASNPEMAIHVHVSETKKEHEECLERHGMTPIAYFAKHGVLRNALAAHCVWVTDEDLQIMKEYNVTIAHNPTSNLKLGSGIAPIAKALEMGVKVAIGTDGCASNNNLNMFEEMHLAALLQKGVHTDPTLVSVSQVLDMATVNGAAAMGFSDTGELICGKRADIIALDMNKPHLTPVNDVLGLLVYSAQASDVCMTMVDGKILYNGK